MLIVGCESLNGGERDLELMNDKCILAEALWVHNLIFNTIIGVVGAVSPRPRTRVCRMGATSRDLRVHKHKFTANKVSFSHVSYNQRRTLIYVYFDIRPWLWRNTRPFNVTASDSLHSETFGTHTKR